MRNKRLYLQPFSVKPILHQHLDRPDLMSNIYLYLCTHFKLALDSSIYYMRNNRLADLSLEATRMTKDEMLTDSLYKTRQLHHLPSTVTISSIMWNLKQLLKTWRQIQAACKVVVYVQFFCSGEFREQPLYFFLYIRWLYGGDFWGGNGCIKRVHWCVIGGMQGEWGEWVENQFPFLSFAFVIEWISRIQLKNKNLHQWVYQYQNFIFQLFLSKPCSKSAAGVEMKVLI